MIEELESFNESDFIFYKGDDGNVHAQVILGNDSAGNGTIWMSQKSMGDTFGTTRQNITMHLDKIFQDNEVDKNSVCKEILHTAADGKNYKTQFYNLEAILSVGYRVSSYKATKFRQWSSRVLTEYLTKGFVLDDERLKQGNKLFGKDHFKELLERVREIRASERMFYEKVTDLYALSEDYDKLDPTTKTFFQRVQAKLEYAITGKTPAELIKSRVNSEMPNAGLQTWKNAKRDGKIMLSDVKVAKNVLTKDELKSLNTLVSAFLDHAEMLYDKQKIMKMSDWATRLDRFLDFNEYKILKDGGSVKRELANAYAEREFNKFKVYQDKNYISDFNRFAGRISSGISMPTESEFINDIPKKTDNLSDFNSKLNTALNYNPIDKKKPKDKVPKGTKKCPRCGGFLDKKLNYCNHNILDENMDVVACGYSFGAIDGKDAWD